MAAAVHSVRYPDAVQSHHNHRRTATGPDGNHVLLAREVQGHDSAAEEDQLRILAIVNSDSTRW
jgi:hypothetical protein